MKSILNIGLRIFKEIKKILFTTYVAQISGFSGENLVVNHYSSVTKDTFLGSNVNFNGLKVLGGGRVTIGDYFHSGFGCKIMTSIHNYDKGTKIPYDEEVIHKNVFIGDFVWFGIDVTVLPGVTIGEGAIIQAGSVVTTNIPNCGIAGGHPAKVFKYRDKDHYYKLKKEKKFF